MGEHSSIGSKQAKKLAREELQRQERYFAHRYARASEAQLLRYVANAAKKLGFVPLETDIVGGAVLRQRLGSWAQVLQKAGLSQTDTRERVGRPDLFIREVRRQEMCHQRALEVLRQQENEFAEQHQNDSDEELLAYIREFAQRLKYTPNMCEIIGGEYISGRFNGWNKAVRLAGLPEPRSNPPKPFNRLIYLDELKRQRQLAEKENVIYTAPAMG